MESGRVDQTLDEIRERFGNTAFTRGVHVGRARGWEMPQLPD
ncbi:hypothetical protein [Allobranchiibius sp. GilTou73]|nr:hypothetical protein [Allobranchiibius sp. GilTou73]